MDEDRIKQLAESVLGALDANYEDMETEVMNRLQIDPALRPYYDAWLNAVHAEKSGRMTGEQFDLYQDWFADNVRNPLIEQIILEVLARAITIAASEMGASELRFHRTPIRKWESFVIN